MSVSVRASRGGCVRQFALQQVARQAPPSPPAGRRHFPARPPVPLAPAAKSELGLILPPPPSTPVEAPRRSPMTGVRSRRARLLLTILVALAMGAAGCNSASSPNVDQNGTCD